MASAQARSGSEMLEVTPAKGDSLPADALDWLGQHSVGPGRAVWHFAKGRIVGNPAESTVNLAERRHCDFARLGGNDPRRLPDLTKNGRWAALRPHALARSLPQISYVF